MKGAGLGTNIYIMDTGVRITHESFGGRAAHFQNKTVSPYLSGNILMVSLSRNLEACGLLGFYILIDPMKTNRSFNRLILMGTGLM